MRDDKIIPVLAQLLREHWPQRGSSLLTDATLMRNLLADYAPEQRAERNLLVMAVQEQVPQELAQNRANGVLVTGRLAKRLEDHLGIAPENAYWAVCAWAQALGVKGIPRAGQAQPEQASMTHTPAPPPRVQTPKVRAVAVTDILPAPFEWCKIPQGHVTIEGQRILVPAFSMAKYPITYAQFEVFVEAPDGYRNDEWWEGLARRDKEPFEQKWKLDKHPRENVNWYQAMAFCRWLGAKTGLPITLPTESQWQRAAQGDDGREYPWGKGFDKLKCNTEESGTGRTTPVDKFPKGASPFGVMDMAGNVWEWCLSKHADPYQHPEDNDPDGDLPRVLRGGSWYNGQDDARAADRGGYFPNYWLDSGGFRVVSSAPVP